jgi:hypothetical protein
VASGRVNQQAHAPQIGRSQRDDDGGLGGKVNSDTGDHYNWTDGDWNSEHQLQVLPAGQRDFRQLEAVKQVHLRGSDYDPGSAGRYRATNSCRQSPRFGKRELASLGFDPGQSRLACAYYRLLGRTDSTAHSTPCTLNRAAHSARCTPNCTAYGACRAFHVTDKVIPPVTLNSLLRPSLLHDVGQFMSQKLLAFARFRRILSGSKHNIAPDGERASVDLPGNLRSL